MSFRCRSVCLPVGLVVACAVWPAAAASVVNVGAAGLAGRRAYPGGTDLATVGARQRRLALRAGMSLATRDRQWLDGVQLLPCDSGSIGELDAEALLEPDADELLLAVTRDAGDLAAYARVKLFLPAIEPGSDELLETVEPLTAWEVGGLAAAESRAKGGVVPVLSSGGARRPVLLAVLATLGLMVLIGAGAALRR